MRPSGFEIISDSIEPPRSVAEIIGREVDPSLC